jgi:hypothetical protein
MSSKWTLLSHHAHVLIALDKDPEATNDQIALSLCITSRSVFNLINDPVEAGYLSKTKVGCRNHYEIKKALPLSHLTSHG